MRTWAWRCLALLGAGLLAAFLTVPNWLHWWLLGVIELAVVAALLVGPRLHGAAFRRPWRLAAAGVGCIAVADLCMTALDQLGAPAAVVSYTNLAFPVGYLLYGAAVWTLVWASSAGGGRRAVLIDGAIVAVGIALVLWQLLSPADLARRFGLAPGLGTQLTMGAYPLMLAVVSAVTVLLVFTPARRVRSAWLMFLAGLGMLVANSVYMLLLRSGADPVGGWADGLWPLAYLFVGLAALHPSMAALKARPAAGPDRTPLARASVLAVALVLTQASVLASHDRRASGIQLAVVSLLLTGVALWRMVSLMRERELAKARLRRTVERQALVADLGDKALTGATDDQLMSAAGDALLDDFGGAWAGFMEPGPDGRWLRVRAASGAAPAAAAALTTPADVEVVDLAEVGGRAVLVPVRGRRATFGALVAGLPAGHSIGEAEQHFVRSLANVLAAAFERHQAEDEIRRQALHDPLTGLPNRVLLGDRLRAALARTRRSGRRVAVLFIDLDHFKRVNDTHGHRAGDQLLRLVVSRLRPLLRAEDTLARFAGDEFVAVTEVGPGVPGQAEAMAVAERINRALANPFRLEQAVVEIGGSIGVMLAGPGDSAERLLSEADAAMYRAKQLGRGRSEAAAGG